MKRAKKVETVNNDEILISAIEELSKEKKIDKA